MIGQTPGNRKNVAMVLLTFQRPLTVSPTALYSRNLVMLVCPVRFCPGSGHIYQTVRSLSTSVALTPSLSLWFQGFPRPPCWDLYCSLSMFMICAFLDFSKTALLFFMPMTQLYLNLSRLLTDLVEFQSDINIIDAWFSNNHLTANASKTKVCDGFIHQV